VVADNVMCAARGQQAGNLDQGAMVMLKVNNWPAGTVGQAHWRTESAIRSDG